MANIGNVWVFIEQEQGKIAGVSLQLVSKGRELADRLGVKLEGTYEFMDGLFKEYLEGEEPVFRGKRVHIGTDEYSNKDPKVVDSA